MKLVLSIVLGMALTAQAAFCDDAVVPSYSDVAYSSLSKSQVCNVYLPASVTHCPVIILVHGGGFAFGTQNDKLIQPVIRKALTNSYAVFSVDYRKSSEAVFPGALADVKACVRWVKANAEKYGINPDNITIWGESAGAYLSVMTKLTPDAEALNGDVNDNADYSSSVNNLVSFYAPVEFYTMDNEFNALNLPDCANHNKADSFESKYLGQALNEDKAATYKTYWGSYTSGETVGGKIWIQAGTNDRNVPYTQSVNLAERLNGESLRYSLIDGAGHMDAAFYTDENLDAVFAFLGAE